MVESIHIAVALRGKEERRGVVMRDAGDTPEPTVVWSDRWCPIDRDPARDARRQGAVVAPVERRVDGGV
jgi:hypothetical protein